MSKIVLSPSETGSGDFTIVAPSTNGDQELTLPVGLGTLALRGDVQFHLPISTAFTTTGNGQSVTGTLTLDRPSRCLFYASASQYSSTTTGNFSTSISIDGIGTLVTRQFFFNQTSVHMHTSPCLYIGTLNTGTYTVRVTCSATTDNNDNVVCAVISVAT
jgi:hypothetical protein